MRGTSFAPSGPTQRPEEFYRRFYNDFFTRSRAAQEAQQREDAALQQLIEEAVASCRAMTGQRLVCRIEDHACGASVAISRDIASRLRAAGAKVGEHFDQLQQTNSCGYWAAALAVVLWEARTASRDWLEEQRLEVTNPGVIKMASDL